VHGREVAVLRDDGEVGVGGAGPAGIGRLGQPVPADEQVVGLGDLLVEPEVVARAGAEAGVDRRDDHERGLGGRPWGGLARARLRAGSMGRTGLRRSSISTRRFAGDATSSAVATAGYASPQPNTAPAWKRASGTAAGTSAAW